MEQTSTDKRINDLSDRVGRFEDKVDRRFERFEDKVDARFDKVDAEFDARFGKVDAEFKEMATKEQLQKIDARFDRWGKIVSGGTVAIVVAVVLKLIGV